ncbi:similar to Saccharomyces cerevisiae YDR031W MIC14 Mitochondrial intermembrane space protein of unknown function [Geotrichum candidum]|uniref:IMS import disulfide relay-system CHCH-CHCH-like Cx9C domain-containing protein n=1 Tax=Geotrichum candidum TaxID=1173061 RepID=A0A0J9XJU2_GEOCN|nr:similar to Saccharomyces cerevisiae YDR031W MIC14 Mitochondrial intermembrane space protein of unknown function [Geotrichum candidum]
MSMLLDQALVEDVARYCPAQFLEYHQCLGEGDASRCLKQQEALSSCVQTKVPSFVKILSECQSVMKVYENCIKDNSKIRSKCFEELKAVRNCSANAINAKENLD